MLIELDQGQGACMAIEDAASLAVVLPQGTPSEEVTERLKLYQKIRYERVNRIQQASRDAAGKDPAETKPRILSESFPLNDDLNAK